MADKLHYLQGGIAAWLHEARLKASVPACFCWFWTYFPYLEVVNPMALARAVNSSSPAQACSPGLICLRSGVPCRVAHCWSAELATFFPTRGVDGENSPERSLLRASQARSGDLEVRRCA